MYKQIHLSNTTIVPITMIQGTVIVKRLDVEDDPLFLTDCAGVPVWQETKGKRNYGE